MELSLQVFQSLVIVQLCSRNRPSSTSISGALDACGTAADVEVLPHRISHPIIFGICTVGLQGGPFFLEVTKRIVCSLLLFASLLSGNCLLLPILILSKTISHPLRTLTLFRPFSKTIFCIQKIAYAISPVFKNIFCWQKQFNIRYFARLKKCGRKQNNIRYFTRFFFFRTKTV